MNTFQIVIITAFLSVALTVLALVFIASLRLRTRSKEFSPVYEKSTNILQMDELVFFKKLEPLLSDLSLRLIPGGLATQIAVPDQTLNENDSLDAFMQLDGRQFHFMVVGAAQLNPVAVIYIIDDKNKLPFTPVSGKEFVNSLLKSIGVSQILVTKEELQKPIDVAQRIKNTITENV